MGTWYMIAKRTAIQTPTSKNVVLHWKLKINNLSHKNKHAHRPEKSCPHTVSAQQQLKCSGGFPATDSWNTENKETIMKPIQVNTLLLWRRRSLASVKNGWEVDHLSVHVLLQQLQWHFVRVAFLEWVVKRSRHSDPNNAKSKDIRQKDRFRYVYGHQADWAPEWRLRSHWQKGSDRCESPYHLPFTLWLIALLVEFRHVRMLQTFFHSQPLAWIKF